jgi:hypothetical protein
MYMCYVFLSQTESCFVGLTCAFLWNNPISLFAWQNATCQQQPTTRNHAEASLNKVSEEKEVLVQKHDPLLDARRLSEQESLFMCTMESNAKRIMDGDVKTVNPLTKLWRIIDASNMLRHGLSEYLTLAEIAIVLVLGSVEDERTFSTLSFMKDRVRNRLETHLPMVVTMHSQSFYDIDSFPYGLAYSEWKKCVWLADEV